jgi:hypothetical protein
LRTQRIFAPVLPSWTYLVSRFVLVSVRRLGSLPPVVRTGIRALKAGRISVVPGWAKKALVILTWATPRWLHQAFLFLAP